MQAEWHKHGEPGGCGPSAVHQLSHRPGCTREGSQEGADTATSAGIVGGSRTMIVGALFGAGGGRVGAFDRYSLVFTITNPLFRFNVLLHAGIVHANERG